MKLKELREENGITQAKIAEQLNIKQNTYSQYETGVISLTAEVLIKLANFYDVSIDYLLGETNEKQRYKK